MYISIVNRYPANVENKVSS